MSLYLSVIQHMLFDVIGPIIYLFTIKMAKYTTIHHIRATSLPAQLAQKFGNLIIGGVRNNWGGLSISPSKNNPPPQLFGNLE